MIQKRKRFNYRIHDSIAGKTRQARLFRIGCVLIHVDEHVIAGSVGVLKGVIEFRACFLCWRWADVASPIHDGAARVLPTAPAVFKVASTSEWDFI